MLVSSLFEPRIRTSSSMRIRPSNLINSGMKGKDRKQTLKIVPDDIPSAGANWNHSESDIGTRWPIALHQTHERGWRVALEVVNRVKIVDVALAPNQDMGLVSKEENIRRSCVKVGHTSLKRCVPVVTYLLQCGCFHLTNDTNSVPLGKQPITMVKYLVIFGKGGGKYFLRWTSRLCVGMDATKKLRSLNETIPSSFVAIYAGRQVTNDAEHVS